MDRRRDPSARRSLGRVAGALAAAAVLATASSAAAATPNAAAQWNKIAEDTVVASGGFQNEGLVYMAYASAAAYNAAVAIDGGYRPYGAAIAAPAGASAAAAVDEAAYQTLRAYFPSQAAQLDANHTATLGQIPDGQAKARGEAVGLAAANAIITQRNGDGRMTLSLTSTFPLLAPGAGVWRLTPPAFAAPQTPWIRDVRPFVLGRADRFLPQAPPSLASSAWARAFNELKEVGGATSTVRTPYQTAVARFWTANVIRQYNRVVRDLADAGGLDLVQTARLAAMVNVVGADAQIACLSAKYHYLRWRPVTAIDPASVTADGFGPVPGFDDGNPNTAEESGWRPLVATPNHPEYPAAHGSLTSAMAEVFSRFLGSRHIGIDVHGFNPAGTVGNLDAVRHFARASDLRHEIVNARLWAGLHFRFSSIAGVKLGRAVARYDLARAFMPARSGSDDESEDGRRPGLAHSRR
jgi:hypothetical protein